MQREYSISSDHRYEDRYDMIKGLADHLPRLKGLKALEDFFFLRFSAFHLKISQFKSPVRDFPTLTSQPVHFSLPFQLRAFV